MSHKNAAFLGVSIGLVLGASGGVFFWFTRPVPPPMVIEVEQV